MEDNPVKATSGQCGACTVLANGRRIGSCLSFALSHNGDVVKTIKLQKPCSTQPVVSVRDLPITVDKLMQNVTKT